MNYQVLVFDIKNIQSPQQIDEFTINADSKGEAADIAHQKAEKLHSYVKRLVQIKSYWDTRVLDK